MKSVIIIHKFDYEHSILSLKISVIHRIVHASRDIESIFLLLLKPTFYYSKIFQNLRV